MTIKAKKSKINLREKLAELLNFRQIRDRLDGLGLYLGKDRTGTTENLAVRGGANVDDLQLAEISAALGGTAVDVFVYDTRNDSDGGKWRERTSHTSWYNEELNTSTRGSRREFPAVAVIVAESDKVTIYDGDDPDMNMWMVFNRGSGTDIASNFSHIGPSNVSLSSIHAVNSQICIAGNGGSDMMLFQVKLINDHTIGWFTNFARLSSTNISKRNTGTLFTHAINSVGVISTVINDVAMTVLPNAPIDAETGLPVPTIAVATDVGISVIKDDGSVVDKGTTSAAVNQVQWMGSSRLVATAPGYYGVFDDPFVEESAAFLGYISDNVYYHDHTKNHLYQVPNIIAQLDANSKLLTLDTRTIIASTSAGLNVHEMGEGAAANNNHGIATYITSEYNTGWMPGDIKLAALSDTKIEKVGVDESTELVTNGHFTTDTTGWSSIRTDLSIESEKLKITINDGVSDNGSAYQELNLIGGKKYTVSGYIENGNAVNIDVLVTNGINYITDSIAITSGSLDFTFDFIADYNLNRLVVRVEESAVGQYAYADNISVKQTGELITNGTFDDGTEGWEQGNTASIGWDSSNECIQLQFSTGNWNASYQEISTEVGKKYTVSGEIINNPGIAAIHAFTSNSDSGINWDDGLAGSGNFLSSTTGNASFSFVATGSITYIYLLIHTSGGTSSYYKFDNISVRLAEDDRSVNNNGLQVFGEITKSPVAPGADLVAYSGFSADDYLMQPYNSDLDFGTGDFCVMGWVKKSSSLDYQVIASYGNGNILSNQGWVIRYGPDSFQFRSDVSGGGLVNSPRGEVLSSWLHVCFVRSSGALSIYENGSLVISQDNYTANLGAGADSTFVLGTNQANDSLDVTKADFGGSLALWRISATAPTSEQIARIYRDEKPLFQDGAQATLYGTSDAVTALAYDDKTELLHVGTNSGRSDFAGLRRINNTTIPVTTSISASNNLIAEQ